MFDTRSPESLRHLTAIAIATYKTSRMATDDLRKLGRPSSSHKGVEVALRVIAALQSAYHIATPTADSSLRQVRLHWKSLSLWIKHLIEVVVLSEDGPSSPETVAALDHALILLPSFLDFPTSGSGTDDYLALVHHSSPFLPPLIIRAWFKVLKINHWTYGLWSVLLVRMAVSSGSTSWLTPSSHHDHVTREQGITFASHIDQQLVCVRTMPLNELREFLAFICCPVLETRTSRSICSFVPGCTLPVLVRLLGVITRHRKQVQTADLDSDEYAVTTAIIFQVLSYISSFVREPYFALEALESGIIRALFKAHPCFLRTDDSTTPLVRRFYYLAAEIVDRIAKLLVFPAILHQFWRSSARTMESYLELGIPMLSESWGRAQHKASTLHEFRRTLKKRVSPLCHNYRCPGESERARYLRCMGCELKVYCSRECRKLAWSIGNHRERCKMESLTRESQPSMIQQEQLFLHEWLIHCIRSHLVTVAIKMVQYRSELHRAERILCPDEQLVVNKQKNPILVIDLEQSRTPGDKDIHVFNFRTSGVEARSRLGAGWEEALIGHWKNEPSISSENILVAALFPGHAGYRITPVWTSMVLLKLPLVEPLSFSIPNDSFTCNEELNNW
ncbi:hypothetical protein PM082_012405 [Marasmius tenuissimus]|nr:hypothetical protein PM082_012405 [Marasmius tenuissimus]